MRRGVWLLAGLVTVVEVASAGGYGYHRDELYFLASGQHLAWGYADQGPVVPFLARLMSDIAPDSLYVLRLPSALAVGAVVLATAAIVRELEGDGRAELIAAAGMGASSMLLFDGHLLETSTVDLLVWSVAGWLALRAVRTGNNRLWLLVGLVLGVGLLNKPLPAFLGVALLVGIAVAGPRRVLRSPYPWLGAVIAVLIAVPWVLWGGRVSLAEFENLFWLFSVAGNETLRNGLPGGLLALLSHPDQYRMLLADRGLLDGAIEEMLRWWTPVMHFRRTATVDTELSGMPIRAGDKVAVWFTAANRDETVFADPDAFDITRTPNDHLTFGHGPHFCLGAPLARIQMRAMFEAVLDQLGEVELAGTPNRLRSNFQHGVKHLPIRWRRPGPRSR